MWAIFFNGETGEHVVAKEEHPIAACVFSKETFSAKVLTTLDNQQALHAITVHDVGNMLNPAVVVQSLGARASWNIE